MKDKIHNLLSGLVTKKGELESEIKVLEEELENQKLEKQKRVQDVLSAQEKVEEVEREISIQR